MALEWLYKRTRILNLLHRFKLASAHSQMVTTEKTLLARYSSSKLKALEVGTYMGVSANIIARAMAPNGKLYCVDPFLPKRNSESPGYDIARRDLTRNNLLHKVIFLEGFSTDPAIIKQIPKDLDFIFIDGDHSYEGLMNDWNIVRERLKRDGIVCLHDTLIPVHEEYRNFGSVKFFNEVVKNDIGFQWIDSCHSMTVLRKL